MASSFSTKSKIILALFGIFVVLKVWSKKLYFIWKYKKPEDEKDSQTDIVIVWTDNPTSKLQLKKEKIVKHLGQKTFRKILEWKNDQEENKKADRADMQSERDSLTVGRLSRWVKTELEKRDLEVTQVDASFWSTCGQEKDNTAETSSTPSTDSSAVDSTFLVYTVSAPFHVLSYWAEEMELQKDCVDGTKQPFKRALAKEDVYTGMYAKKTRDYFTVRERQSIVSHIMMQVKSKCTNRSLFPVLAVSELVDYFSLHDDAEKSILWEHFSWSPGSMQSLTWMTDYLGSAYGFYFAWLHYYTLWLVVPSVVGVGIYLFYPDTIIVHMIFSIMLLLGAVVFLELWKRRQRVLAYEWGETILSNEASLMFSDPRPTFHGTTRTSPITDRKETYYPSRTRLLKYLITFPACFFMVMVALAVMWVSFEMEEWAVVWQAEERFTIGPITLFNDYITAAPGILHALGIAVLNMIYTPMAYQLTEWENHRLARDHRESLVFKLFMFYFVNSYFSLFICIFALKDLDLLRSRLASLLITFQILDNLTEVLGPGVTGQFALGSKAYDLLEKEKKKREGTEQGEETSTSTSTSASAPALGKVILTTVEAQGQMPPAPVLFDDYLEIMIQFGYIVMFSWAWPLAPVFALLNNVIEMRSDAYKLICLCRRPMPEFGKSTCVGIGPWFFIMRFLTILSILTATACWSFFLFFIADREDPHLAGIIGDYLSYSDMTKVMIIIGLEHTILCFHFLLQTFIPDTPREINYKVARTLYQQQQMLRRVDLQTAKARKSEGRAEWKDDRKLD